MSKCFTGFCLGMICLGAPSPELSPAPGDVPFLVLPSFSGLCFNLCHVPLFLLALGVWLCTSGGLSREIKQLLVCCWEQTV